MAVPTPPQFEGKMKLRVKTMEGIEFEIDVKIKDTVCVFIYSIYFRVLCCSIVILGFQLGFV